MQGSPFSFLAEYRILFEKKDPCGFLTSIQKRLLTF